MQGGEGVGRWLEPSCGKGSAPRLEVGRQKRGRVFPMGLGVAGAGGLRPAAWRDSAAMRTARRRKQPPCGQDNDSCLEAWRRKRGKAFLVGLGLAGMGGLRPAAWRDSAAMSGNARHAVPATSALWAEQRPSFGDWATEKRRGASGAWGWAGCAQPRGSILQRWAAMRSVAPGPAALWTGQPPRLEIGRQKTARCFRGV